MVKFLFSYVTFFTGQKLKTLPGDNLVILCIGNVYPVISDSSAEKHPVLFWADTQGTPSVT